MCFLLEGRLCRNNTELEQCATYMQARWLMLPGALYVQGLVCELGEVMMCSRLWREREREAAAGHAHSAEVAQNRGEPTGVTEVTEPLSRSRGGCCALGAERG